MLEPERESSSTRKVGGVGTLLILTLVVRLAVLALRHDALAGDPDAYREVAVNLAAEGTFGHRRPPGTSNEYPAETAAVSPTAHRPPLYPMLLAPTARLGAWSPVAIGALHLLCGLLTVWVVFRLALAWEFSSRSATVAALLTACDPILLNQSAEVMTETLATLMAVTLLVGWTAASRSSNVAPAMVAGVAGGLAILCRPTFLPAVLLGGVVLGCSGPASRARRTALYLAAVLVAVSPWVVRNQLILGRPILTTTHGGHTLRLANNPQYFEHVRTHSWGSVWDSKTLERVVIDDEELRQSGQTREVLLDRRNYELAFAAIRSDPGGFVWATIDRLYKTWRPAPAQVSPDEGWKRRTLRWTVGAWYLLEFALVLVGLVALGRKAISPPWLFGAILLATFTLAHAVYWTDMRMRAPLVPVICLLAAAGVERLTRPSKGMPTAPGTR